MFEFFKRRPGEKKIYFGTTEAWMDGPDPAVKHVPDWYKKAPKLIHGDKPVFSDENGMPNLGVKYCIPFLDALTTGYMATLWQDLIVQRGPEGVHFQWANDPNVVDGRSPLGMETLPIPAGHVPKQYIWQQPYTVKVPKGYSVVYTHPLNRHDLPFTTLSGVHDSDEYLPPGNFPFYLHEDFEGVIPKGTPIFQIIPFKRENWVGRHTEETNRKGIIRSLQSTTMVSGFYKKFKWSRKSYRIEEAED